MESMKVFVDFSLHSNAISQVAAAKNSFGTYKFLNVTMHVFCAPIAQTDLL